MNPGDKIDVWVEGGGKETLSFQNYRAQGGEGSVFQKGGTAFKIMHPGKKVIPRQKLNELSAIKADNVLRPLSYLLDSNGIPIGFTMTYVQNVEFLCKLFNSSFRQQKGLTSTDIVSLVRHMQETLIKVHEANVLVVDFNQMNFLVDGKKFTSPYFIDTDSYQTPSFPATALMECVRDRTTPKGKFTQMTDWFSWACVTFWLYTGLHPYRGTHPMYKPLEWNTRRMDDNVSVFHPDVSLPSQMQDLSVIPKPHLEWYKQVFLNKQRSTPPFPDGAVVMAVGIKVKDVALFVTIKVAEFDSPIRRVYCENGTRFVVTNSKIWKGDSPVFSLQCKYEDVFLSKVDGGEPVLAVYNDEELTFINYMRGEIIHKSKAEDVMFYDGRVYSRSGNVLTAHFCKRMDKEVFHTSKPAISVFGSACELFDGVAVQDMLGKCVLAVPTDSGKMVNVEVKELDGVRVIDAKCIENVCVVIGEKNRNTRRYVITFTPGRSQYHVRDDEADPGDGADFIRKSNGLCIAPVEREDLESWVGANSKVFKKGPIPSGAIMHVENDETMFIVDKRMFVTRKS
jgi:hypothetical protein